MGQYSRVFASTRPNSDAFSRLENLVGHYRMVDLLLKNHEEALMADRHLVLWAFDLRWSVVA